MNISIIIPTYNRKKMLENCLKSLFNQTYPKDKYEIIIVDDGSTDETRKMIEEMKRKNLHYFYQKNQGPAVARNLGIKKSKGGIIALIDTDCVARKDWLKSILSSYEGTKKEVGGIGGLTVAGHGYDNIIGRIDQTILNYFINRSKKGKEVLFLPTCNLSFRKEIFNKVGLFDKDFKYAAGEDSEFCWRVIKNGYKLIYEPEIKVEHCQRNNLISFCAQNFKYGKEICLVRKKHPDFGHVKSDSRSDLKRYFQEIFVFPFQIASFFPKWYEKIAALFLTQLRQIVFFMGIIAGRIKYK